MEATFKKVIELPEAFIREREDGIIHVTFKEGVTLDIPLQMRLVDAYNVICEGTKRPFLFDAFDHVSITKEAKENAVKIESMTPVIASAIIATNLAYRLVAEFYIKFNKPKYPLKTFKNHKEGIAWLKQFLNKTYED